MGNLTPKHKAHFECRLLQEAFLDLLGQSSASLAPLLLFWSFISTNILASVFLSNDS